MEKSLVKRVFSHLNDAFIFQRGMLPATDECE